MIATSTATAGASRASPRFLRRAGCSECSARADRASVKSLLVVSRHRATSLPAAPSARRPCHESLGTGDRRPPRGKCPVRGIDQTPRWRFRTARAGASGQRVSALGDTSRQGPAFDPRCARNLYWAPVLGSGRRHVVEPSTERRSRDRQSGAETGRAASSGGRLGAGSGGWRAAPVSFAGRRSWGPGAAMWWSRVRRSGAEWGAGIEDRTGRPGGVATCRTRSARAVSSRSAAVVAVRPADFLAAARAAPAGGWCSARGCPR